MRYSVTLSSPMLPNQSVVYSWDWSSQQELQICNTNNNYVSDVYTQAFNYTDANGNPMNAGPVKGSGSFQVDVEEQHTICNVTGEVNNPCTIQCEQNMWSALEPIQATVNATTLMGFGIAGTGIPQAVGEYTIPLVLSGTPDYEEYEVTTNINLNTIPAHINNPLKINCNFIVSITPEYNYFLPIVYYYAVEITPVLVNPNPLILNSGNYSTADLNIAYTIQPQGYNAGLAQVDLLSSPPNAPDSWLPAQSLVGGTSGTATATLLQGAVFDASQNWAAQVVLNRGTPSEIDSSVVPFTVIGAIPVTLGLTKQLAVKIDPYNPSNLLIFAGKPDSSLQPDWGLNNNVHEYPNGRIEGNGLFRAIHLNPANCGDNCVVTASMGGRTGRVIVLVNAPTSLGDPSDPKAAPFKYDSLIIQAADAYGVPPQIIKAIIADETSFNPNNFYRYEPFYDAMYVSIHKTVGIEDFTGSLFWLNTGPTIYDYFNANPNKYPESLWRPKSIATTYDTIKNSQGVTIADQWLKNYLNYGILSGNPNNGEQPAIAQTTIAASYGLMQVIYPTALNPMGYPPTEDPTDLLIPQNSINFGTAFLQKLYNKTDQINWDSDWKTVIGAYNTGNINNPNISYADKVITFESSYMPKP